MSRAVALIPAVLVLAGVARADLLVLAPSHDATLYEDVLGATANGSGPTFFAGRTDTGNALRRALISFDLGAIPAGSVITAARLKLHLSRTISTAELVTLHRVGQSWGEGPSLPLGEGGQGAAALPGDSTWTQRFVGGPAWGNAGGDFEPLASDATLVGGNGTYTWGLAGGLVGDVQAWVNDPSQNMGWMLRGNEEVQGTAKRFDSRENPELANRPSLIVEYRPVPAPAWGIWSLFLARRPGRSTRKIP